MKQKLTFLLYFQALSRKELRPFRRKLIEAKALKRCGKRIQFHCDPNNDKSITEPEWLYCTLQNGEPKKDRTNVVAPPRRGPNPLQWLNEN